jgi:hypothetical protein
MHAHKYTLSGLGIQPLYGELVDTTHVSLREKVGRHIEDGSHRLGSELISASSDFEGVCNFARGSQDRSSPQLVAKICLQDPLSRIVLHAHRPDYGRVHPCELERRMSNYAHKFAEVAIEGPIRQEEIIGVWDLQIVLASSSADG